MLYPFAPQADECFKLKHESMFNSFHSHVWIVWGMPGKPHRWTPAERCVAWSGSHTIIMCHRGS